MGKREGDGGGERMGLYSSYKKCINLRKHYSPTYTADSEVAMKDKLNELRKKWVYYHKLGDEVMCGVIERQAKALKIRDEDDKYYETAKKIFS